LKLGRDGVFGRESKASNRRHILGEGK